MSLINTLSNKVKDSVKMTFFVGYQTAFNAWLSVSYSISLASMIVGLYLLNHWGFLLPDVLYEVPKLLAQTHLALFLISLSALGMLLGRMFEHGRSLKANSSVNLSKFIRLVARKALFLHLFWLVSMTLFFAIAVIIFLVSPDYVTSVETGSPEHAALYHETKGVISCFLAIHGTCFYAAGSCRYVTVAGAGYLECFSDSQPPFAFSILIALVAYYLQSYGVNLYVTTSIASAIYGFFVITLEHNMLRAPNGEIATIEEINKTLFPS